MTLSRVIAIAALTMMPLGAPAWAQDATTLPALSPSPDQTAPLRQELADAEEKERADASLGPLAVQADEEHIRALQQMIRDAAPSSAALDSEISTQRPEEYQFMQNRDEAEDSPSDDPSP